MALWCISTYFLSVLAAIQLCHGYNIDVDHIRIFKGTQDSLFGYTTLFHRTGSGYELVVGAPKANSSLRTGTGATYSCDVSGTSPCTKNYHIRDRDRPDISASGTWYNDAEMYGSFISQTPDDTLVVCAPRYNDLNYEPSEHSFLIGRCVMNGREERPLYKPNAEKYFENIHAGTGNSQTIYWNGMGEAGTSGDVLEDGSVVLGIPGFGEWRGGVVILKSEFYDPQQFNLDLNIPDFSYIGYSLTTGNFCGKGILCFVTGGPRKGGGKVFLYQYTPNIEILTLIQVLEGEQTGSYFGASLCAADVNGDGNDDLLVGAPFFSNVDDGKDNSKKIHMDEGRVGVFLNRKIGTGGLKLEKSMVLKGSNKASARFGTAIANIGDINKDGFQDVAIGAPYEDEGRGVVYIYHGSEAGLKSEVKQRILGREIRDDISSFGWSISRPADVDDNKYPDFSVGNYLSNTAVILRTRPIVGTQVTITTDPTLIVRDTSSCPTSLESEGCFRLRIDFRYTGVSLPDEMKFNYTVKIDTYKPSSQKRVELDVPGSGLAYQHSEVIDVRGEDMREYWVKSIDNLRDLDPFTIVRMEVDYNLILPSTSSDIQPIANNEQSYKIVKDIAFQLACGDDNECWSDLRLDVRSRVNNVNDGVIRKELNDAIVVNATDTLILDVGVRNDGEDAFANVIYVTWTGNVNLQTTESDPEQPVICKEAAVIDAMTTGVECNVILPVKEDSSFGFKMFFPTNEISTTLPQVNFTIAIESQSNETNPADNVANDTTTIWIDARTTINGNAKPEETVIPLDNRDKTNLKLLHKYVISNDGPSFLPATVVTVRVPYYKRSGGDAGDETLVNDASVSITQDDGTSVECLSGPDRDAQKQNQTTTPSTATTTSGKGGATSPFLPPINPAKMVESPQRIIEEGNTRGFVMDCVDYLCEEYECELHDTESGGSAVIDVVVKIRADDLPFDAVENVNYLRYLTDATVKEPSHPLLYPWTTEKRQTLSTLIYPEKPPAKVNIWIIIGSVIGAILLLIIILIIFYKLGFFKRKKKGQIQKWKRESGYYRQQQSRRSGVPSTSGAPDTNGKDKTS